MKNTPPIHQSEPELAPALVESTINTYRGKPGALLSILEELQNLHPYRYLEEATLAQVASGLHIPQSQVYSVATFYSYFNLVPQGKHTIVVCRGTACHTRGSLALLQEAMSRLGHEAFREADEPSFTTADRLFTVKTVACFGQCALAPVIAVDGRIYSRMNVRLLAGLLEKIRKEAKK
ncbi:MAG: NAD(P)H-dependent oxidoreductase subunit E [Treponema sp.]|nr:NAD(P)H-dependent oxidoreductase subunit E [Treponema sp.]